MTFDECIKFLSAEPKIEDMEKASRTAVLQALVGTAYRYVRTSGGTPEESMRWILWALFYFVQQEHRLSAEDEEIVLAMAAAKNSFAFCGEPKKGGK